MIPRIAGQKWELNPHSFFKSKWKKTQQEGNRSCLVYLTIIVTVIFYRLYCWPLNRLWVKWLTLKRKKKENFSSKKLNWWINLNLLEHCSTKLKALKRVFMNLQSNFNETWKGECSRVQRIWSSYRKFPTQYPYFLLVNKLGHIN